MHGSEEWVYVLTDKFGSWFGLRDFYYFIIRAYIFIKKDISAKELWYDDFIKKRELKACRFPLFACWLISLIISNYTRIRSKYEKETKK